MVSQKVSFRCTIFFENAQLFKGILIPDSNKYIHLIGHVNNIPTMPFFIEISRNTHSKLYMLSLTEYAWDFQNNTLWDTHYINIAILRQTQALFTESVWLLPLLVQREMYMREIQILSFYTAGVFIY